MSRLILRELHGADIARKSESRKLNGFRTSKPLHILKESFLENAQCLFGEICRRCSREGRQEEWMRPGIVTTNRGTPKT
ncbi:MAG: hypothetical protein ACI8P0_005940, partial [Planctomycetaceae bacterium]